MKSPSAAMRRHRLRQFALCSTALSVSLLAGSVAMAAAPAAGSLPGNFNVDGGAATYAMTNATSNTEATITVAPSGSSGTGVALDFNGAGTTKLAPATTGTSLPSGVTQNPGFSVGSGATVAIKGAGNFPLLINDSTGNPSQIYGSVTNDGTATLFIANANGVVVGATGSISTSAGLGLLGFAQSGSTFVASGTISVDSATGGTGGVTVDAGAQLSPKTGDAVLVASNGAINIGSNGNPGSASIPFDIVAGYGVSGSSASAPTVTASALSDGSSASVTFSGGSSTYPILVKSLNAAGNVTNSGVTDFTGGNGSSTTIGGAFSNTGIAYVNTLTAASITNSGQLTDAGGTLTAVGLSGATSGADITNTGVIKEGSTALTLDAGNAIQTGPATGNFTNSGVIAFKTSGASLTVDAANINFGGSVTQATSTGGTPTALSSNNHLADFTLNASYMPATGSAVPGVVDFGSNIYAGTSIIEGAVPSGSSQVPLGAQAVRILSGGLYGGTVDITVGTGTATDPFANNAKLGYNLSVFPKATIEASSVNLLGTEASSSSSGSNMNLDGVVSTQVAGATAGTGSITVTANNINGNSTGGFSVNDGDKISLTFSGNVNNPYGASAVGSSDFRYNYVPVAVANAAAGGAGTVNLDLTGPTNSTTTAQNVNILVNGNVAVTSSVATATLPTPAVGTTPGTPISPASSYVNNHLVLQATGNVDTGTAFYWPGLLYLNTVSSMSNPTQLSTTGAINVDGDLSNILPAFSTGGTGIFLETNNLNMAVGSTITTSNNSWVNFASAKLASAFSLTQATSFFAGYKDTVTPTVTELGVQQLPAANYQP
ncbi:filamentous hemagglutinin N-terminal domain-containing protein [Acidiphilium sp. PM]|uniref:beta strand repeat-containing protein n=1 Tax=Acidiphilium sp. PM TaxID=1043206 RepID=UPI0002E28FE5|nr:filamentous hemagglutinin N-terminal domain-containing protein [Acidiphilium sp. PM]